MQQSSKTGLAAQTTGVVYDLSTTGTTGPNMTTLNNTMNNTPHLSTNSAVPKIGNPYANAMAMNNMYVDYSKSNAGGTTSGSSTQIVGANMANPLYGVGPANSFTGGANPYSTGSIYGSTFGIGSVPYQMTSVATMPATGTADASGGQNMSMNNMYMTGMGVNQLTATDASQHSSAVPSTSSANNQEPSTLDQDKQGSKSGKEPDYGNNQTNTSTDKFENKPTSSASASATGMNTVTDAMDASSTTVKPAGNATIPNTNVNKMWANTMTGMVGMNTMNPGNTMNSMATMPNLSTVYTGGLPGYGYGTAIDMSNVGQYYVPGLHNGLVPATTLISHDSSMMTAQPTYGATPATDLAKATNAVMATSTGAGPNANNNLVFYMLQPHNQIMNSTGMMGGTMNNFVSTHAGANVVAVNPTGRLQFNNMEMAGGNQALTDPTSTTDMSKPTAGFNQSSAFNPIPGAVYNAGTSSAGIIAGPQNFNTSITGNPSGAVDNSDAATANTTTTISIPNQSHNNMMATKMYMPINSTDMNAALPNQQPLPQPDIGLVMPTTAITSTGFQSNNFTNSNNKNDTAPGASSARPGTESINESGAQTPGDPSIQMMTGDSDQVVQPADKDATNKRKRKAEDKKGDNVKDARKSSSGSRKTKSSSKTITGYQCPWTGCDSIIKSQVDLALHLEKRHVHPGRDNKYSCRWKGCSKANSVFKSHRRLLNHVLRHACDTVYACNRCPKTFTKEEAFKTHMRIHKGERPYKCPKCNKTYSNSSDRTKHLRTHQEAQPYKCHRSGCDKTYTDPSSLRKHLKTHENVDSDGNYTGGKPYPCERPGCDKRYTDPSSLRKHMRAHAKRDAHAAASSSKNSQSSSATKAKT
eukprot:Clim_evm7s13 gene=Clim_evmTU7s13